MRERLLVGGVWVLGGQLTVATSGVAVFVLLTRMLTPSDVGVYVLAQSLVVIGTRLGLLGLNQSVVRLVSESLALNQCRRAESVVWLALRIMMLAVAAILLLAPPLCSLLATYVVKSSGLSSLAFWVGPWIAVRLLQKLLAETCRGFRDIPRATIVNQSLSRIVFLCSLTGLWLVGNDSLTTVIACAIASIAATCLLGIWFVRSKLRKLVEKRTEVNIKDQPITVATLAGVSLPLMGNEVMVNVIRNANVWIVGAFFLAADIAVYGAAARLTQFVGQFLLVNRFVLSPHIAAQHVQARLQGLERLLRNSATIIGLPVVVALLGFIFFGNEVLGVVLGEYYAQGASILMILSLGQLVRVCCGPSELALAMTGYQKVLMVSTFCFGALNIVSAIAFAPYFGLVGIAASRSIWMSARQITMVLLVKHKIGIWSHMSMNLVAVSKSFSRRPHELT